MLRVHTTNLVCLVLRKGKLQIVRNPMEPYMYDFVHNRWSTGGKLYSVGKGRIHPVKSSAIIGVFDKTKVDHLNEILRLSVLLSTRIALAQAEAA